MKPTFAAFAALALLGGCHQPAPKPAPATSTEMTYAEDPYLWLEDIHGEKPLAWVAEHNAETAKAYAGTPEFEALSIMGLEPPITLDGIKARYKELAKQYHPDLNQGDKKAEDLLKSINMAYTILKLSYAKFEKLEARS